MSFPWNFIITGGTPTAISVFLFFLQRYYSRRDYWNSRKDGWLKSHYKELAKTFENPFDFGLANISRMNFLIPNRSPIRYNSVKTICDRAVLMAEKDNPLFISDKEVWSHIHTGYKNDLEEIISTTVSSTTEYYKALRTFVEELSSGIIEIMKDLAPTVINENNFSGVVNQYCLGAILDAVLEQLDDTQGSDRHDEFSVNSNKDGTLSLMYPRHPNLSIFPPDFSNSQELIEELNKLCIVKIQEGGIMRVRCEEISAEWKIIYTELKEVKDGVERSGLTIKGKCNTCRATMDAKELIPPD